MLKRVLLAYARWNKNIGYCQGLFKIVQLFVYLLLQIAPDLQLQEILQENLDDTNNVEIIPEVLLILR